MSPRTALEALEQALGLDKPLGEHVLYGLRHEGFELVAIEREASSPATPALDVERLAAAMCEVTMPDGTPCQGHRRSAARILARLTHPDSDGAAGA